MTSWESAITRYVNAHRARLAERTITNRLEVIGRFARAADVEVQDVTLEHFEAFLGRRRADGRPLAKTSVQREQSDLQSFFRFLVDRGIRHDDPSAKLKPVKVPPRKPRPYSLEQIEALLAAGCYRRTRVMILLGYGMGLRVHEIAKVHARDIQGAELAVLGKGGVLRHVPIHPLLVAEIERMPHDGYWFPSRGTNTTGHIHWRSVSDLLSRAKRRAGITDPTLTGHSLRHSYGTQLVWSGTDLRTAQELLGHASLATTEIYTKVDPEKKTAAVHALPMPQIPRASGRRRAA